MLKYFQNSEYMFIIIVEIHFILHVVNGIYIPIQVYLHEYIYI